MSWLSPSISHVILTAASVLATSDLGHVAPHDNIKRIEEVYDKELATRAAWLAQDRAKEAKESAEMMLQTSVEAFLGEFHVVEPQQDVNREGGDEM